MGTPWHYRSHPGIGHPARDRRILAVRPLRRSPIPGAGVYAYGPASNPLASYGGGWGRDARQGCGSLPRAVVSRRQRPAPVPGTLGPAETSREKPDYET